MDTVMGPCRCGGQLLTVTEDNYYEAGGWHHVRRTIYLVCTGCDDPQPGRGGDDDERDNDPGHRLGGSA